jgi:hypothetical protein
MIEPQAVTSRPPSLLDTAKLALAWCVTVGGFIALAASLLFAISAARAATGDERSAAEASGPLAQILSEAAAGDARS